MTFEHEPQRHDDHHDLHRDDHHAGAHHQGAHGMAAMRPEDEIYTEGETRWSGEPNGALIDLISEFDLADNPGRVVDFGCGEGADVIWLSQQGFDAIGVDSSAIAIAHARAVAAEKGASATFIEGAAPEALPEHTDVLIGMYAPVHSDEAKLARLLGTVASGGYLIVVHHYLTDDFFADVTWRDDYLLPHELAQRLDPDGWDILVDEVRARRVVPGVSAHHTADEIVVARKKN